MGNTPTPGRSLEPYSPRERLALATVALIGGALLNGVFLYAVFLRPDLALQAARNPITAALMIEALILTGALAHLLRRWRVSELRWGWFVLLSLAGGLAFALPFAVLWRRRR